MHVGHLEAARQVRAKAGLDQVWLVPNAQPPHRSPPRAAARDRLAMVRLAVEGDPALGVTDVEVARGGRSYTIETLDALARTHPDRVFTLLLGSDVALGIRSWHGADRLLAGARFLVFNRAGATPLSPDRLTRLGFDLDRTRLVEIDAPAVSARDLRDRLQRGLTVDGLLPRAVLDYIRAHRLYQGRVG